MIGLRLYDGLFKVIPLELDSNKELKAFNIRSGHLLLPLSFVFSWTPNFIWLLFREDVDLCKNNNNGRGLIYVRITMSNTLCVHVYTLQV